MEVKVTKDKVLIVNDNYIINKGEFDINECDFNFSEEYTNDLVKKAEFVSGEDAITILIEGDKCSMPYEMLSKEEFELRVYAFKVEDGELVLRYSPTPTTLYLREGSFKYASGEVITPSEAEQIEQEIQNLENSKQDLLVSGVNIKTINNQTILGEGNLVIEGISVDYDEISNKPKINDVELIGNKTSHDLGLQPEGNYLTEETDPIFTESVAYGITSEDIASWNAKYDLPSGGIPKTDLASAVQTSLGKADTALQSFTEQDPVFSASASAGITSSDITAWNNKSDFSGSYTDLTNKPTIPSATSQLTNDSNYVADASYVHTDNNYTSEEKIKLAELNNYVLPTASANTLGGVKVGNNLSIDANGVLSASGGSLPVYYIETNVTYRMYNKDTGVYVIKNTSQSAINVFCASTSSYAKSIPAGKEGIIFVEDYSADKKRLFFFKGDEFKNVIITSSGGYSDSTSYTIPALLNSYRASSNSVLSIENQVSYTPTSNYHPATKKYVDDSIATQIGNINTILATLTTPSGGNS